MNKVLTEVKAMRLWMGERVFWAISAVLVIAMVALVFALASGSSSSSTSSTSSTTTTTSYPGYEDNSAYVTPGWNNATNKSLFAQQLQQYEQEVGSTFPNSGVFYNIGIDTCIQLRKGRSDRVVSDAQRDKVRGKTWAVLNAAIDVYCPDQSQYRDLVGR